MLVSLFSSIHINRFTLYHLNCYSTEVTIFRCVVQFMGQFPRGSTQKAQPVQRCFPIPKCRNDKKFTDFIVGLFCIVITYLFEVIVSLLEQFCIIKGHPELNLICSSKLSDVVGFRCRKSTLPYCLSFQRMKIFEDFVQP